mgnify:CR=1 FL=1
MEQNTVTARVSLNEYTNKVLGVLKAKYGLKDKSEAINKFIELYGEDVVENEASDEYLKKVLEITDRHIKEYKRKKMSFAELDKLTE